MSEETRASTSIMIGTPAYTGCTVGYINSLLRTKDTLQDEGVRVVPMLLPGVAIISHARNEIGRYFQLSGCEWLFSVDSDLHWDVDSVLRMLARAQKTGAKFLCAVQPIRKLILEEIAKAGAAGDAYAPIRGRRFSARMLGEVDDKGQFGTGRMEIEEDGFGKIDAAGVAFALIHRDVFTKLAAAHPELRYRAPDATTGYALFDPFVRNEFAYAEDMAFCRRYRDLGGDIWLLVDAPLVHEGPYLVAGNFRNSLKGSA